MTVVYQVSSRFEAAVVQSSLPCSGNSCGCDVIFLLDCFVVSSLPVMMMGHTPFFFFFRIFFVCVAQYFRTVC